MPRLGTLHLPTQYLENSYHGPDYGMYHQRNWATYQFEERRVPIPVHRCLKIPEILSEIFKHVDERPQPSNPRTDIWSFKYTPEETAPTQTLARLARTCIAFYEPAINILWREIDSLVPLVMCLPQAVVKRKWITVESEEVPDTTLFQLTRALQPKDFERIHHYAHRVKSYRDATSSQIRSYISNLVDSAILALMLPRYSTASPLLPNLIHATVPSSNFDDCAEYARLIIGSQLKSLEICVPASYSGWDNIEAVLKTSCPGLRDIAFKLNRHARLSATSFVNLGEPSNLFFSALINITSFDASAVSAHPQILKYLADLPALQSLKIMFLSSSVDPLSSDYSPPPYPPTAVRFPVLSELSLRCDTLQILITVLSLLRNPIPCLEVVKYTLSQAWPLEEIFAFLNRNRWANTLERLTFTWHEDLHRRTIGQHPYQAETFEELINFKRLTHLHIDPVGLCFLSNADLLKLAPSWPEMQSLGFICEGLEPDWQEPSTSTLKGLVGLVARMTKLEDLSIRVDARYLPTFAECAQLGIGLVPQLRFLNVCTSPMEPESVQSVIAFLMLYFPNLEQLTFSSRKDFQQDGESFACWEQVHESIRGILAGRRRHF